MRSNFLKKIPLNKKILYVFSLAIFIPIIGLTFFSSTYFSKVIENESHQNLVRHAKSYGLFTLEKFISLENRLSEISLLTESELPNNIVSEFSNIELIQITNPIISNFDETRKTKLSHIKNKNELIFTFEKYHKDSLGDNYVLRASLSIDSFFSLSRENPYNEPICIFSESGKIIFCNEDIKLKNTDLTVVGDLIGVGDRIIHHKFNGEDFALVSWELFLESTFQSESWHFVIIKQEGILLSTIKKFQSLLIPVALLFYILISYGIFFVVKKLFSPLHKLVAATKDISRGIYDLDLDVNTSNEFSELSASFSSMCSELINQHKKDNTFSSVEESILAHSDIHLAIKKNIQSLAELFNTHCLIISIIDPLDFKKTDTHCLTNQDNKNNEYSISNHSSYQLKANSDELYFIESSEFHAAYNLITKPLRDSIFWVKKLKLNNELVGHLIISRHISSTLSSIDTTLLLEFSERFSNIYSTHRQKAYLHFKANYDSLTKLPNRYHLLESLKIKWHNSIKRDSKLILYYIDLDNFKNVNDSSGHDAGNQVLLEAAKRIAKCTNEKSIFARLSGDEFCILTEDSSLDLDPRDVAKNIIKRIEKPFVVKDMSFFLGVSIGIVIGPNSDESPESLIEKADLAMYKSKQDGKNRYTLYNDDIEKERSYRLSLENYLHYALERNEISINYQPKINLLSGKLTSVEALARWHQSDIGFIPTDQFILLAEDSGMINEIGAWILKKSCYQYLDWLDKGIVLDSIAVNVSARQLASRNFSDIVASVLQDTGMPPQCLDLEITESAFINDESLLKDELNKLHSLNVKISIDDFGKEYSSLSYLKKIPFDTLKIDREFIIDLATDIRDQHIIEVIINIGHTLNKKIVAEGIESIEQRDILIGYGCDVGQGYLFSKPLTDIQFLEFSAKFKDTDYLAHNMINRCG